MKKTKRAIDGLWKSFDEHLDSIGTASLRQHCMEILEGGMSLEEDKVQCFQPKRPFFIHNLRAEGRSGAREPSRFQFNTHKEHPQHQTPECETGEK